MIYFCSQKNRRALVLQYASLNGIDYLEVAPEESHCGKHLLLTFLKDARSLALDPSQVQVTGGATSKAQVKVLSVSPATSAAPKVITVNLDQSGDFSTYTLSLVANSTTSDPPEGVDPQLSTVSFSFKAGCPTVGDCLPDNCSPPDISPEPDINYLAKDFGSFRQVMLDRMAVLTPGWSEARASDVGIAMVETLAYAADHLSYQQDAVGTEAYLGKARSRISLRRHAKLVDYKIGEGSNARVWIYLNVSKDGVMVPSGTLVYPSVPGFPVTIQPGSKQAASLVSSPLGFATMQDSWLYKEQNEISFYTWGDTDCCLAPGVTQATLAGNLNTLHVGSILVFEEILGPNTGDIQDANPDHRWAVRLTAVRTTDHLGKPLTDPLPLNGKPPQPITQISWAQEDALPFPLCISSTTDAEHRSVNLPAVSVARGNIIPADHGAWTTEDLGEVPSAPASPVLETSCTCNSQSPPLPPRPRYYPELANSPVTFAWPLTDFGPASAFLSPSAATFVPLSRGTKSLAQPLAGSLNVTNNSPAVTGAGTSFTTALEAGEWLVFASDVSQTPYQIQSITNDISLTLALSFTTGLTGTTSATVTSTPTISGSPVSGHAVPQIQVQDDQGQVWDVLDDLLSSDDSQRVCVLEIEHDGTAFLRFGDGQYGMTPEPGMDFQVHYRVGNGSLGNVGRDTIGHVATSAPGIIQIRNPLAAAGGVDRETMEHIRQVAPFAFRTQLRAVTEDDYGAMAQLDPAIREARGTLRWTGSWYTAFVSLDAISPGGPDSTLLAETRTRFNLLRMAGVDLEVEGAVIVGLDIELNICVDADHFQADVEAALMQLFTTGNQCTGQPGLLNPENFSFGQTIYTSPFIAAAQSVPGVSVVTMAAFHRMDDPSTDGVALGYLTLGRLEIARCDNDPNGLDHGIFILHMDGGK